MISTYPTWRPASRNYSRKDVFEPIGKPKASQSGPLLGDPVGDADLHTLPSTLINGRVCHESEKKTAR
jgi:hypothetical protein